MLLFVPNSLQKNNLYLKIHLSRALLLKRKQYAREKKSNNNRTRMLPNHRCLLPKLFAVDRNAKRISHYLGLACSLYSCVSLCFIVVCSRTAIKTHFQQSRPIFSQSANTAIIEQMNKPTVRTSIVMEEKWTFISRLSCLCFFDFTSVGWCCFLFCFWKKWGCVYCVMFKKKMQIKKGWPS